jgi:hypothetical protein
MNITVPDIVPLFQPDQTGLCGQTVVAMAAGISIDEAVVAVGVSSIMDEGGTYATDLIRGLRKLGVKVGVTRTYPRRPSRRKLRILPKRAILSIADGTRWGHWVLYWDGFVYDPGIGWPIPIRVYETSIVERAYSRCYDRPQDAAKQVIAYWNEVIPILEKE